MSMTLPLLALIAGLQPAADPPPSLSIDPGRVTVSGMSSGAYAAFQLHVAHSDLFSGAGLIAAGPWGCAEGALATAMGNCMGNPASSPAVEALAERLDQAAADGRIAPTAHLADDPVWLFRGTLDALVAAPVAAATFELYSRYSDHVVAVTEFEAAHAFPTRSTGSPCNESLPPFIARCDYDAAGILLKHLYGPGDDSSPGNATLYRIETSAPEAAHLLDEAALFVPEICESETCGLHVVLHGCGQSSATVADAFIDQAGYLEHAAEHRLVLLFPQVRASAGNPFACWDWWGYSGANYLDRDAPQQAAVVDLIRRLVGEAESP